MAWRNVWRNTRRSIVCIAAMALALCIMVLYSGLIRGYLQGMERNILDLEVGDVQIFAPGYLEKPDLYTRIEQPEPILTQLEEAGYAASPRLKGGALVGSEDASAGVQLIGLDVQRDTQTLQLHKAIARGQWIDPADPLGVVIGNRLALILDADVGSELVVLAQAADGSMGNDLFHVRGVLQSVADGTDRGTVFVPQATFRTLMVIPEGVHQIIVRRPDHASLDDAANAVHAATPDHLEIKTWKELMPTVAQMLESTDGMVVIIFMIIYLAVGLLILNAMLMAVFERIQEFGVFKAIGGSPFQVLALIFAESFIQIAVAIAIGLTLALPGMWYLSQYGLDMGMLAGVSVMGVAMEPIWYGIYTAQSITQPVAVLVFIALLAVTYPAIKAALIQPVEAMRHH